MQCMICERSCDINVGKTGLCGVYENNGTEIVERFPDRYLVSCPISIETMPILHYYPGGKFYQISTAGCNFDCPGCISTVIVKEMNSESVALFQITPEEVVAKALQNDCIGIAFLMNDPIVSFPTFLRVAKLAKKRGLLVGCSSNAYFTEAALDELNEYLDFINIGFKGIEDYSHPSCGGRGIGPILRNLQKLFETGVHIEVSTMYRLGNEEQVMQLAKMIAQVSPLIPFQVMRYIPLESADISSEPTIKEGEILCEQLKQTLRDIYLFNSPGTPWLNTVCPDCGRVLFERDFYGPMGAKLLAHHVDQKGQCDCGYLFSMDGLGSDVNYEEGAFEGGYPFTRALEMIEAILITIGVTEKKQIVAVWEKVLREGGLKSLHHNIQEPQGYLHLIREYGQITGLVEQSQKLADYMEAIMNDIQSGLEKVTNRPRVYYVMGKTLFCLKGERLENKLVEWAGGIPVNKELECGGRPGSRITVDQLNILNPDMIFISSFIGNSFDDFYRECIDLGVAIKAVKDKKIFAHPVPGWDFGSPRWIFGLMNIANVLHPDIFCFDLYKEAALFYRIFYQADFSLADINRSFSKPSSKWVFMNEAVCF